MTIEHYAKPDASFTIPTAWIGKTIEIALALPAGQGNAAGGMSITYPAQSGELLAIHDTSIEIRYDVLIKGERKKKVMCLPKSRIWAISIDDDRAAVSLT